MSLVVTFGFHLQCKRTSLHICKYSRLQNPKHFSAYAFPLRTLKLLFVVVVVLFLSSISDQVRVIGMKKKQDNWVMTASPFLLLEVTVLPPPLPSLIRLFSSLFPDNSGI